MLRDHVLRSTDKFERDLLAAAGTVMQILVEAVAMPTQRPLSSHGSSCRSTTLFQ